jgi:hypothetical protein
MGVTASMDTEPSRWNDERLDEFAANVDKRFDRVDGELARVNGRLDDLMKVLIAGVIALTGAFLAALGGVLVLIATQL